MEAAYVLFVPENYATRLTVVLNWLSSSRRRQHFLIAFVIVFGVLIDGALARRTSTFTSC
jgi:hypothetical protein